MTAAGRATYLAWALVASACVADAQTRSCSDDDGCLQDGNRGQCLPSPKSATLWCAFTDGACSRMLRWGLLTGDGLASQCVAPVVPDASTVDARGPGSDAPADAGATSEDAPTATLSSSPTGLAFGTVTKGTSSSFGVTIHNLGGFTTGALSTGITGTDAAAFAIADDFCAGTALGAGSSCSMSVTFAPSATGPRSATLTVGAGAAQVLVPLSGAALQAGALKISPTSPVFPSLALGSSSMLTLTVMNTGGITVPGILAMLSGTRAADFSLLSDGCTAQDLGAGSSCAITLLFNPAAGGTSSASLLIAGTSGGSTSTSLTGTATVRLTVSLAGTGSGTVTSSSPTGISCPDTCATDLAASSVLLTATPSADSRFDGWSTCVGTGPCTVSLTAAKTVTATFTLTHLCVDAAAGSDANAGTCTAPLKTIKRAFQVVPAGGTVQLRPGTYSTATNGESFPVVVPAGITLVGDEASKGTGAAPVFVIGEALALTDVSANHAAMVAGSSSTIAGLRIGTPDVDGVAIGGILIEPSSSSITVRNNTFDAVHRGSCIVIKSATNIVVAGNAIANVTQAYATIGINSFDSSGKVESNVITGHAWGASFAGTTNGLDFGGGPFGSAGQNTMSCSSITDVALYDIAGTFSARGNAWDHTPPAAVVDCLTDGPGKDYCGAATLDAAGATLATSPCP